MAVTLEHLNKTFGKQTVLKDVCLKIDDGEVVALLGPNGAGKSTMMKIIAGIWDADKGSVVDAPSSVGYLPEQNPLYEEMFVREYLLFMARIQNAGDDVEALIDKVGLTPEANKKIGQLSKGYRQRVGLAQAMMGNPDIIILDEPTTGLDPNQLIGIRELIRNLVRYGDRKRIVILSTHIMQEVREMCDRVLIIDHGVIRADKSMNCVDNLDKLFVECTN